MSTVLELSLAGQNAEAAKIWADEIKKFHAEPPTGLTVFDADGPVANLMIALDQGIVPQNYRDIFNLAAQLHSEITEATMDNHVVLHYHSHHFNFMGELTIDGNIIDDNGNNQLIGPTYGVYGPAEREAPAFIYNPVDPASDRIDEMLSLAMDFEVAKARLDAVVEVTGWDRKIVSQLNFVRSVENWANRLVKGTPEGQLPPQFWEEYTTKVAAPLMGLNT